MKLLVISLCTQGVMKEHFIYYCRGFAKSNELYCITNDNITNEELHAKQTLNLKYDRSNPFGYFSILKLMKMKKYISEINPDIVYVFTHHASSLLIPPIIKKYKVVYQVHDPVPHLGVGKLNAYIIRKQLGLYSKLADFLVVAGEAVKSQVLMNYNVAAEKIKVIPFAVLDNYINDNVDKSKENIDILFFGRIEQYKGIDTLFDALNLMQTKPITYIAGKGDIKKVYPNIEKIPDNVNILGFVEDQQLISYIKACKLVVLPYHEATGTMTVCQVFYYGCPVIASNVGVFPEYVQDAGIIFEHGNAKMLANSIENLLADTDQLKKMSKRAKEIYLENFRIENACLMHQELFVELANKGDETHGKKS